jgi:hypothetical protein
MKIPRLLFFALLGIGIVSCSSSNPGAKTPENFDNRDLSLVFKLDKIVYNINEPVIATLTLYKEAETNILINARMGLNFSAALASDRDVTFFFTTPSGQEAGFLVKIRMSPLNDDNFVILYSGDSIQEEYDLEEYYLLDEIGTYTTYAIYENQFDPQNGLSAWKGQIKSNTLQFEIK